MEQILPGQDPEDYDNDPIIEAIDLKDAGDHGKAIDLLMGLCQSDLRCLDAHAHLGNFASDLKPAEAIRHFAVGVGIGELSLGCDFSGLLPWGLLGNRPFILTRNPCQFKQWATQRLREYLLNGCTINQKRLEDKNLEIRHLKTGIECFKEIYIAVK